MKQRVAIARSLAFDPEVLLMDEPFAALDAQTRESLQDELLRIWKATGKTILFITHGIDEAIYLGQRVAVLTSRPGRVKTVVDIDIDRSGEDVRSNEEFRHYRHQIWTLLHDEVGARTGLNREARSHMSSATRVTGSSRCHRSAGTSAPSPASTPPQPGAVQRAGAASAPVAWRILKPSVAIVAFLALWEIAPRVGLVDEVFLPPFSHGGRGLLRPGRQR